MKRATWSNRQSLLAQLDKLWERGVLLQALLNEIAPNEKESDASDTGMPPLFPRRLVFKKPGSQELSQDFDAVRQWVSSIQKLNGFRIVYKTIRHPMRGRNDLPAEAWVDTLSEAIALSGRKNDADQFRHIVIETQSRAPELINWLRRYPVKALSLAESWAKLLDFVIWRQQHPAPGIYLRQVSLPGIDSKFVENHRGILAALLDEILSLSEIKSTATGIRQFEERYGFLSKPVRVRFRILDPSLQLLPGTDRDISLTAHDFQALGSDSNLLYNIKKVFITENEINFLSFQPMPESLVIFGAGYGFDALAKTAWMHQTEIFYWGDIDTNGFAILDQIRQYFPHTQSLLMDEETLLSHQHFHGREEKQTTIALSRLTPEELSLYQSLLQQKYGKQLRLEQEHIQYNYVINTLEKLMRPNSCRADQ